jgi:hypothetical protein
MRSRCQYLGVVVVTSVSGVFGVLLFYLNTKHAKQDLKKRSLHFVSGNLHVQINSSYLTEKLKEIEGTQIKGR